MEHNLSIIIWCEGPIWENLYCWSQFTKIIVARKFYHTFTIVFPLDLGLIQRKVNDAILKVSAINYKKKIISQQSVRAASLVSKCCVLRREIPNVS